MPNSVSDLTTIRKSNIELLRIVGMILIVAHHFSVHSIFNFSPDTVTVNRLWIQFLQLGGKVGVDIFVLISGYFLIKSPKIKTSKVIKIWIQIFTYSILLYAIFTFINPELFGIREMLSNFLPVISTKWWFASTYFVLYIISPYLNKLLNNLDKQTYKQMLVIFAICWCLIPTFFRKPFEGNNLIWFIFLYIIAGYIRIYAEKRIKKVGSTYIWLSVVLYVLTFLSAALFDLIGIRVHYFSLRATMFFEMDQLPVLLISLLAFIGFLKIKIDYSWLINVISSATFGIYLIHDNDYVRPFLWKKFFRNATYADSAFLIPYSLAVIIIVFLGCTVIELCRIYIFEKQYMNAVNKLSNYLDNIIEHFFS
jgi:Uncharacterized protein conserved in bacteria